MGFQKKENLKQEDIDHIKSIYSDRNISWDQKTTKIGEFIGRSERVARRWLKALNISQSVEFASPQYEAAKKKKLNKTKRYIITWGQADTQPHDRFLSNIEAYARYISADIHVIAGRYKNPTSLSSSVSVKNSETWHSRLLPYLDANRHNVHKYLTILSDVKVQPTASQPLDGMHSITGHRSCVVGSPKVQLSAIPVIDDNRPKLMMTTGSVTMKNYTDTKVGKVGEFHHTFGFVVIEIDDEDTFYVRQVTADDANGSFNDLNFRVEDEKVMNIDTCQAFVLGDIHYGKHNQDVIDRTTSFMDKLVPENVVLHDVFDGYSINHHEKLDPFIQYGKEMMGTNDLGKELNEMLDGLEVFRKYNKVIVVRSNHDDFLDRWLKSEDWKKQPTMKNSAVYMDLSTRLLKQHAKGIENVKGVIPELIEERFDNFIALDRSTTYKIKGIEVGMHGDIASNGSRGSLMSLRKLNTKLIVGHYHTPGRIDGALAVGTSTVMRMGYNVGPSSWVNAHVIIHSDGRMQHIIFAKNRKGETNFSTMIQ